jgi:hypothetical protein
MRQCEYDSYICACEAETTIVIARAPVFAPILWRTHIIGTFRHPCCSLVWEWFVELKIPVVIQWFNDKDNNGLSDPSHGRFLSKD